MALQKYIYELLSWFFPSLCGGCSKIINTKGICSDCWSGLELIDYPRCEKCGYPRQLEAQECKVCLRMAANLEQFAFDKAISCFVYSDLGRRLILKYKSYDKTELGSMLASLMAKTLWQDLDSNTLLIPIPLHPVKLWQRRYNQAGLLAGKLSEIKNLSVRYDIIKRHKLTSVQGRLSRSERIKNLENAFIIDDVDNILSDRTVLLVDDVFTTGATLSICAAQLRKHKVKEIRAITLARTVHSLDKVS